MCTAKRSARALRRNTSSLCHDRVAEDHCVSRTTSASSPRRADADGERDAAQERNAVLALGQAGRLSAERSTTSRTRQSARRVRRQFRCPGSRSRRRSSQPPRDQPAVPRIEARPIVADEPREAPIARAVRDQLPGQRRFARPGSDRGSGSRPRRRRRRSRARLATLASRLLASAPARRTMKRAPRRRRLAVSSGGPGRFSARIVPRWASMICREIDSPRPEFWPKPCSGRSV